MSDLKIVSDGTPQNTHITVDGKPLTGVTWLAVSISVDGRATCTLRIDGVSLNLDTDVTLWGALSGNDEDATREEAAEVIEMATRHE